MKSNRLLREVGKTRAVREPMLLVFSIVAVVLLLAGIIKAAVG